MLPYKYKRVKIKTQNGSHNFFGIEKFEQHEGVVTFMSRDGNHTLSSLRLTGEIVETETTYLSKSTDILFHKKIIVQNEEGKLETHKNIYNFIEGRGYLIFDREGPRHLQVHIVMKGKLIPIEDYPFFWTKIFKEKNHVFNNVKTKTYECNTQIKRKLRRKRNHRKNEKMVL